MYIIVRTDDAGILWRLSPTNSVIECLLLEQSPNRRLVDAVQDLRVHRRKFAASLGADLDLAGALEDIHGKKCIGNRSTDGQQAVIAQHQKVPVAKIGLQARFLVVAECNALVIMVSERREDKGRLLRNRQYAALLRADRDASTRVNVHHALDVIPGFVHGAVDHEASRIDRERRVDHLVAVPVDFDQ